MIITKHKLEGFAGFSELTEFYLKKNPTLLLGVNGAGKTTLLNSIFASIEYCISMIQGVNMQEIGITSKTISFESEKSEVLSEFKLENNTNNLELGYRLLHNGQVNLVGKEQNQIRTHFSQLHKNYDNGILPILRYFQSEKNIDQNSDIVSAQKFNKLETLAIRRKLLEQYYYKK